MSPMPLTLCFLGSVWDTRLRARNPGISGNQVLGRPRERGDEQGIGEVRVLGLGLTWPKDWSLQTLWSLDPSHLEGRNRAGGS